MRHRLDAVRVIALGQVQGKNDKPVFGAIRAWRAMTTAWVVRQGRGGQFAEEIIEAGYLGVDFLGDYDISIMWTRDIWCCQ